MSWLESPVKMKAIYSAKIAVAAGLIWALFELDLLKLDPLRGLLGHPFAIIAMILLVTMTLVLAAWRWHVLLRMCGLAVSFGWSLRVYYIATVLNNFMPGAAGGDAARLYYIVRAAPDRKMLVAVSILLDRILGLVGHLWLCATFLLIRIESVLASPQLLVLTAMVFIAAAVLTMLILLSVVFDTAWRARLLYWEATGRSRFLRSLAGTLGQLVIGQYRGRTIVAFLVLSVVMQMPVVLGLWVAAGAMEAPLGVFDYLAAGSVGFVSSFVPVSPGGIGVGEGAFAYVCRFLAPVGSAAYPYAGIFLALRLMIAVASLPGFVVYVLHGARPGR